MGRMVKIDDLISELQEIRAKFGNTGVYIRDMSWGALALNRKWADEHPPNKAINPTPESGPLEQSSKSE